MSAAGAGQRIILAAEDNADDVEILRRAMREAGLDALCRFVYDGEEAIAYMRGEPPFSDRVAYPFPAVLVLDLSLPRVDGFGVLEWMAKTPGCETVKVVVWTGWLHTEGERRARKAGAGWFMKKYVGASDLAELIALISDGAGPPVGRTGLPS